MTLWWLFSLSLLSLPSFSLSLSLSLFLSSPSLPSLSLLPLSHSMCGVLHPHSHNHGHGHSHGKDKGQENSAEKGSINISLNDFNSQKSGQKQRFWERIRRKKHTKHGSEENINVRAAFIHVIGDLIQSIGVVIAGYIIKFKVEW